MDLDETQLDLIRARILLWKARSRRGGERSWESLHTELMSSDATGFAASKIPFSAETLRRFAKGSQSIKEASHVDGIIHFLIAKGYLTRNELATESLDSIEDAMNEKELSVLNTSIQADHIAARILPGVWDVAYSRPVMERKGLKQFVLRIAAKKTKKGVSLVVFEETTMIDHNYEDTRQAPAPILLKGSTGIGFVIQSSQDFFYIVIRDRIIHSSRVYLPISRIYDQYRFEGISNQDDYIDLNEKVSRSIRSYMRVDEKIFRDSIEVIHFTKRGN